MKAIAQNQKTTTSATAKPQAAVPAQTLEVERPDIATQLAGAALFGHQLGTINMQSRSPQIVQPKLTVGPVSDMYEQQADRVARQVVTMPAPVQRQDELDEDEELQMKLLVQRQDELDDEDDLQMKPLIQRLSTGGFETGSDFESRPNNTGLPDTLKTGVEKLSGYSLDDVKVHYNSAKPAQLNALAYAQGREIHVAPGQEQHLPHEAWHVVQQRQGRVRPRLQVKGVSINDDKNLEREADAMGVRALQMKETSLFPSLQMTSDPQVLQRVQDEFINNGNDEAKYPHLHINGQYIGYTYAKKKKVQIRSDRGDIHKGWLKDVGVSIGQGKTLGQDQQLHHKAMLDWIQAKAPDVWAARR